MQFEVNTASAGTGKAGPLMLELKEMIGMPEDPVSMEARLEGSIRMVGQSNVQTGQQEVQRMVASEAWRALSGSGTAALHGIYLSRCFLWLPVCPVSQPFSLASRLLPISPKGEPGSGS